MDPRQSVQIALLCLKGLDQAAHQQTTVKDLSREQGLSLPLCITTMTRLSEAGIVELFKDGSLRLCRPLDEVTALEILQALWAPAKREPAFRLLLGKNAQGALQKTL